MAPHDVGRFEAAAGPLLDGLGYERGAVQPADPEPADAARLRDEFVDYAHSGGWPVPGAWARAAA
jgi:hypothetical protein